MPRNVRQLSSSKTYHIMIRGNAKQEIFLDDQDRFYFLNVLEKMNINKDYFYIAYCLMSNHVHLLINEGDEEISKIMKRICVSYAYYFNKKYDRVGHLFQDRFRSEVIENDAYLLTAVRYIHNNPVKANIVSKAEEYKWSSYKTYIGKNDKRELIDRGYLLGFYADEEHTAIQQFILFTNHSIDDQFIDINGNAAEQGSVDDFKMIEIINAVLSEHNLTIETFKGFKIKKERNVIIKEIKSKTNASTRKISQILGISKDIVSRA